MQVPIDDIVIRDRVRQEMGDVKPLMNSLQQHGQLNPITLSREYDLIAGHRRILAACELGWKSIEAHIIERSTEVEKLQLELEENVHRKDFSPEELLAGYRRLEKLKHPSVPRRIKQAVQRFFARLFRRKRKPEAGPPKPGAKPALVDTNHPGKAKGERSRSAVPRKEEPDVIGSQYGI